MIKQIDQKYLHCEYVRRWLVLGAELLRLNDNDLTRWSFEEFGHFRAEGVAEGEVFSQCITCQTDNDKTASLMSF